MRNQLVHYAAVAITVAVLLVVASQAAPKLAERLRDTLMTAAASK